MNTFAMNPAVRPVAEMSANRSGGDAAEAPDTGENPFGALLGALNEAGGVLSDPLPEAVVASAVPRPIRRRDEDVTGTSAVPTVQPGSPLDILTTGVVPPLATDQAAKAGREAIETLVALAVPERMIVRGRFDEIPKTGPNSTGPTLIEPILAGPHPAGSSDEDASTAGRVVAPTVDSSAISAARPAADMPVAILAAPQRPPAAPNRAPTLTAPEVRPQVTVLRQETHFSPVMPRFVRVPAPAPTAMASPSPFPAFAPPATVPVRPVFGQERPAETPGLQETAGTVPILGEPRPSLPEPNPAASGTSLPGPEAPTARRVAADFPLVATVPDAAPAPSVVTVARPVSFEPSPVTFASSGSAANISDSVIDTSAGAMSAPVGPKSGASPEFEVDVPSRSGPLIHTTVLAGDAVSAPARSAVTTPQPPSPMTVLAATVPSIATDAAVSPTAAILADVSLPPEIGVLRPVPALGQAGVRPAATDTGSASAASTPAIAPTFPIDSALEADPASKSDPALEADAAPHAKRPAPGTLAPATARGVAVPVDVVVTGEPISDAVPSAQSAAEAPVPAALPSSAPAATARSSGPVIPTAPLVDLAISRPQGHGEPGPVAVTPTPVPAQDVQPSPAESVAPTAIGARADLPAMVPSRMRAAVSADPSAHESFVTEAVSPPNSIEPGDIARSPVRPERSQVATITADGAVAPRRDTIGQSAPDGAALGSTADVIASPPSPMPVSGSVNSSPAPDPVRQIANSVVDVLRMAPAQSAAPAVMDGPLRILTLQLRPMDLGNVVVRMRLRGGQLEMSLHANREETAELLRKDGAVLNGLLRDAGYQSDAITIGPALTEASAGNAPAPGPGFQPGTGGQNPARDMSDQPARRQPGAEAERPNDAKERTNETNPAGPDRSGVYL